MEKIMKHLLIKEKGAALAEYVIIIALIALAAVWGLSYFGNTVDNQYATTGNTLDQY